MKKTHSSTVRFVHSSLSAVRKAIGATITLTAAERRACKGEWYQGARDFGERAALYLDHYATHLPRIPYSSQDIITAFDEVQELEVHLHLLEQLTERTRDTLLKKRSLALRMARGVVRCMQAVLSNPFLDEATRSGLLASLKLLRVDMDRRNQKISAGLKKAWERRRASQQEDLPETQSEPEIIEAWIEPADPGKPRRS